MARAVLSYPASLKLQCYMFIVGYFDEIPTDVVALLPTVVRRKLLRMLPALDLCKLDGTPVSNGISMDEIWQLKCEAENISRLYLYDGQPLTYKECYFQDINRQWVSRFIKVDIPDALSCFRFHYYFSSNIIQGLHIGGSCVVYPHRVITNSYSMTNVTFTTVDMRKFLNRFFEDDDLNLLQDEVDMNFFLSSVVEVRVINAPQHYRSLHLAKKVLKVIFNKNTCQVRFLEFDNFDLISCFLTCHKLKKISVHKSLVSRSRRNRSRYNRFFSILESDQDELESLELCSIPNFNYNPFIQPVFKELTIKFARMPSDLLIRIIESFFQSSNPVTLNLQDITIYGKNVCYNLQPNCTQLSKSLRIKDLQYTANYLPPTLHLKELSLCPSSVKQFSQLQCIEVDECIVDAADDIDELNQLFHITTATKWNITVEINDESVVVREECGLGNPPNIFTTIDKFIVALTNIKGTVTELHVQSYPCIPESQVSSLFEAILSCLQSSLPQLYLKLPIQYLEGLKRLYEIWKQCGSIQLRKLELEGVPCDELCTDIVSQMSKETIN